MSTFSVMAISITVQNSVLDSTGIWKWVAAGLDPSANIHCSVEELLWCEGSLCSWHQRDSFSLSALQRLPALMADSSPTHARVFLLQSPKVWFDTSKQRSLFSLCFHETSLWKWNFLSISSHPCRFTKRREQALPVSGRATCCISKDKAEENKTTALKSGMDWPLPEPL